jgi:ABC-type multidrug transport system ATPase subunit
MTRDPTFPQALKSCSDTKLTTSINYDVSFMVAVELQQVTKLFGRFAALRSVTAEFSSGRCYAIFGENGAGKSTLLRVIAGLAHPTSGKIIFSGDQETLRHRIGYVAHASMLYDEFSAMENLRYFGALYGIKDEQKFAAAIRTVGLDAKLERRAGDYSQGMRQRLSLARMLMHDPEILLLDEPFSNLDVTSARDISALIGTLRDAGKTILVVTHQISNVAGVADHSLLFSQGQLLRCESGIEAARPGGPDASRGEGLAR